MSFKRPSINFALSRLNKLFDFSKPNDPKINLWIQLKDSIINQSKKFFALKYLKLSSRNWLANGSCEAVAKYQNNFPNFSSSLKIESSQIKVCDSYLFRFRESCSDRSISSNWLIVMDFLKSKILNGAQLAKSFLKMHHVCLLGACCERLRQFLLSKFSKKFFLLKLREGLYFFLIFDYFES